MGINVGKAILCVLVVWLVVIIFMTGPLMHGSESDEELSRRLTRTSNQLDGLKKQNEELRALLSDFQLVSVDTHKNQNELVLALQEKLNKANSLLQTKDVSTSQASSFGIQHCQPSQEFELTRRNIENGVAELWYFVSAELHKMKERAKDDVEFVKMLDQTLEGGADRRRAIQRDLKNISTLDGLGDWRTKEIKELSDILQARFQRMQNPKDCQTAKKMLCDLNKGCGYGCQIHHLVYCFIMAYGSHRTLIMKSKDWRYNKKGWEAVFRPISDSCTDSSGSPVSAWPGSSDTQVINLPPVDALHPAPAYLPLAVPKDLSERLIRVHGNPAAWWIGQILKYLLKPQDSLAKYLDEMSQKFKFERPVVGVHIRRTDKVGTEASFHGIEEYMTHVDDFYRYLELTQEVSERRVYLATDDPGLFDEARNKFPTYKFIGDSHISESASVAARYSDASLRGVILDIHLLSQTDYLVCTFSSQVCRLAYEIMQTLHPDASTYFRSLDDVYYFGGQNPHNQRVIQPHKAVVPEEISLKKGDIVGIAGNHWDGFSLGQNRRTGLSGLYPSYKAVEVVKVEEMPSYPENKDA